MCDKLHFFQDFGSCRVAALNFEVGERRREWAVLRESMRRQVQDPFTRDEWAYLMLFLDPVNLERPFRQAFGEPIAEASRPPDILLRPRGTISVWLPSTVSLLGPLMLVLASLTGAPLWLKVGSRAEDRTAAFVRYAREHLAPGPLARYLEESVCIEVCDRFSPRNREMAAAAKVRVVFGSNAAVEAVQALPHPSDSVAVNFGDHSSEAWVERDALTEEHLLTLIRVFAIYGRTGCTSPRRVVVLGGTSADADSLRQHMATMWPKAIRADVPIHLASSNSMEHQLALAQGWRVSAAPRQAAVLVSGSPGLPEPDGPTSLPIIPATVDQAMTALPANIQTIGHCLCDPGDPVWLGRLARTSVKRFVPVSAMHHFGPVWDGANYWRQFFEEVALRT